MSLAVELNTLAKDELPEWYVSEVEALVEWMEEGGVPIFTEPMSEDDEWNALSQRDEAGWRGRAQEAGIETMSDEWRRYQELAERHGNGATP